MTKHYLKPIGLLLQDFWVNTSSWWLETSENVFIASQDQVENPKGVSDYQEQPELALKAWLKCNL